MQIILYSLLLSVIKISTSDNANETGLQSLSDLYENKVKKLRPKCIKKCAEILETRNEYRVQVNQLTGIFQNLLVEEENLQKKEKKN